MYANMRTKSQPSGGNGVWHGKKRSAFPVQLNEGRAALLRLRLCFLILIAKSRRIVSYSPGRLGLPKAIETVGKIKKTQIEIPIKPVVGEGETPSRQLCGGLIT